MMASTEGIVFTSRFGLLVCKVHSTGVHPDRLSIERHLRGPGHFSKGKRLKEAVSLLCALPLASAQEISAAHPAAESQPIPPIPYLTIQPGWSCLLCQGQFLTTSQQLRNRHAASIHLELPSGQHKGKKLWQSCSLQTCFAKTGERRYFQVCTDPEVTVGASTPACANDDGSAPASQFVDQLKAQRLKHEGIITVARNVNPSPQDGLGTELWMKKLGLDRYVAGLHKDEMAASYKPSLDDDEGALQDLRDVSLTMLRETWQWCQQGPNQRMTDPQAARISSFWHAADPEGKAKNFRRTLQPETLRTYLDHWMQMLTFCWNGWRGKLFIESLKAPAEQEDGRVEEGNSPESRSERDGIAESEGPVRRYLHYSQRLQACFEKFASIAASSRDCDQKAEALADAVTAISKALIQQHLAQSPFKSPILAYAAMLSVNEKSGSWTEPGSFNNHMSALIYCGQLWVFRFACEEVDANAPSDSEREQSDDGLDEQLDLHMRKYFTNTVSRPLAYLLLWRRRLFGIAPLTMLNRPAWWNLEQTTVTYQGVSISMDQVRHLCRHTIDRARGLLYDSLMFGADHIPKIMPRYLEENDSNREIGWWFGKHPQNASQISGHATALIEHVANTAELRELYLTTKAGGSRDSALVWSSSSIRLYRQLAQDFLRDLAAGIHFSGGPPVRAPEFQSPMWRNTEQLRHVQLRYGRVMIHLVEHKMMATTGKNVNNIRFLCDELGELLVNYLIYVVPVLEAMVWQDDVAVEASPFLWSDHDGTRWPSKGFGNMLKAACRRAGVPAVGTAIWRQMSAAIINSRFDQADKGCLMLAQNGDELEDIDEDGRDQEAATLVSMSNHSLRTHRYAYANVSPFANIWDGKLVKSYRASEVWAQFFGLGVQAGLGSEQTRKRTHSGAAEEQDSTRKILNIGRARPKRHWTGAALLQEARKLYKNEELRWRCPEQEQAMRLVANQTPEVVLILATGSGKSLSFMLGSSLPGARTTVVIVPLVLLRIDLIRRCQEMGLHPLVWKSGQDVAAGMDSTPTLLFVSVEVAAKHPFRQYAQRLHDTGNLERFMLDECHLIHTSAHYRRNMTQLNELRQYPVPFIYITATLPLRLEKELFQKHHVGNAAIVRGCSKRPNIRYGVEHLQPPKGESFVAFACRTISDRWAASCHEEWTQPRVMIFVRSCADAEQVAECLGCLYYHREIGTIAEKEARLTGWVHGDGGSPFLACTTAAGPGVDYAHVRWVIHLEDPYGLIDYAQESGRGGRDGEPAGATVFLKRNPHALAPPTPLDHPDPADDHALKHYLQGLECRRLSMARELDVAEHWIRCGSEDIHCDVCAREDSRETVGSGAPGSTATATVDQEDDESGGLVRHRRQQMVVQYEMDAYVQRLTQVQGTCTMCRILCPGADWHHRLDECVRAHKWAYFGSKKRVIEGGRSGWMKGFAACYLCGQPQTLCDGWGQGLRQRGGCRYADLVMPTVWALWESDGFDRSWLEGRTEVKVQSGEEALRAAGRASTFGGVECVLGVRILAGMLGRWEGEETQGPGGSVVRQGVAQQA